MCPILADLKPTGKYLSQDLHEAGGIRLVANRLKQLGLLNDQPTVSGKTIFAEADAARETPNQDVLRNANEPIQPTGHLAILKGSVAPEGAVMKLPKGDVKEIIWPSTSIRVRRRLL